MAGGVISESHSLDPCAVGCDSLLHDLRIGRDRI